MNEIEQHEHNVLFIEYCLPIIKSVSKYRYSETIDKIETELNIPSFRNQRNDILNLNIEGKYTKPAIRHVSNIANMLRDEWIYLHYIFEKEYEC